MDADPDRGPRLLLTERDALLPLLADVPPADFERPTVLPGWSVRDVLAHCSAALGMAAAGSGHGFTPEDNERDVAERRDWPLDRLLAELGDGYDGAAARIASAGGRLDGLALGEWLHGGDVRDALDRPDAYASAGIEDALVLLVERSRSRRLALPFTRVTLPDRELTLGTPGGNGSGPAADLRADVATLLRICGGRAPDPSRYRLTGADPARYVLFS